MEPFSSQHDPFVEISETKAVWLLLCQTLQQGENVLGVKLWALSLSVLGPPGTGACKRRLRGPGRPEGARARERGRGPGSCTVHLSSTLFRSVYRERSFPGQGHEGTSHHHLCAQLVGYMSNALKLADLPFSYTGGSSSTQQGGMPKNPTPIGCQTTGTFSGP
ncbi:unnamed protein product [Arctogadus glacialis]